MVQQGGVFKNKYRIKSARYEGYDYSQEGFYFVTICTKNREMYFGDVVDYRMELSEIGKIVEQEWLNTKNIRENIDLDRFIVMPNHLQVLL